MTELAWILGAYLLGAIPASFLAARLGAGIDLREHGSKNLGATNVYRVLGWRYAVPVGAFDIAKGMVPVLLARGQFPEPLMPLAVGLGAVAGHVFSIFMRFKGGKGVATASGVVLALAPLAFLGSGVVWAGVLWLSAYVSLASIVAAVSFPVLALVFYGADVIRILLGVLLAAFIVFTHRANIRRLILGTENRFGTRAAAPETSV